MALELPRHGGDERLGVVEVARDPHDASRRLLVFLHDLVGERSAEVIRERDVEPPVGEVFDDRPADALGSARHERDSPRSFLCLRHGRSVPRLAHFVNGGEQRRGFGLDKAATEGGVTHCSCATNAHAFFVSLLQPP
jgi:hypothetical protein